MVGKRVANMTASSTYIPACLKLLANANANMIGNSKGAALNKLRKTLQMKKKSVCLVPNLLKESQKHARVKLSKKRLKKPFHHNSMQVFK